MTDVNGVPAYKPETTGTPEGTPPGAPYAPAPISQNPAKTLGIVALVLAIFFNIIGAIIGIVALVQSKKAGYKNGPALAAIIVGAVLFVVGIIVAVAVGAIIAGATSDVLNACNGLPTGTPVTVQGQQVACP